MTYMKWKTSKLGHQAATTFKSWQNLQELSEWLLDLIEAFLVAVVIASDCWTPQTQAGGQNKLHQLLTYPFLFFMWQNGFWRTFRERHPLFTSNWQCRHHYLSIWVKTGITSICFQKYGAINIAKSSICATSGQAYVYQVHIFNQGNCLGCLNGSYAHAYSCVWCSILLHHTTLEL